jgi:predicted nucleotidyltransferase
MGIDEIREADLFGCRVDLLTPGGLRNPCFKARALNERVPVYEE